MKTKYLFLAALTSIALVSCTSDEFLGNSPDNSPATITEGINFGFELPNATRGDIYGKAAAELLGSNFYVMGTKGTEAPTSPTPTVVFDNYLVNWKINTAGKTESNTADWEYVGIDPGTTTGCTDKVKTGHYTSQTIKYWDYSAAQYDFFAFSVGPNASVSSTTPSDNQIGVTAMAYGTSLAGGATAYTLYIPTVEDLKETYITDIKEVVGTTNYGKEVQLRFKNVGAKIRVALYETVPGYSVKDVKFYASEDSPINHTSVSPVYVAPTTDATLINASSTGFTTKGQIDVKFPYVGNNNESAAAYDKADAVVTPTTGVKTKTFGALTNQLIARIDAEDELTGDAGKIYLGRDLPHATFAGDKNADFYQVVFPAATTTNALTLRVDYTLVSTDGSKEEIKVYGANAVVPATYTKWQPNYAYTYIFKISDNTNGWTDEAGTKEGLFPITFDAVVAEATDASGEQRTVTTVSTYSITTYQQNHDKAADEYSKTASTPPTPATAKDIYVQVMNNSTLPASLVSGLSASNSLIYELSEYASEAKVMDALQMRKTAVGTVSTADVKGRNGLELTNKTTTIDNTVTSIVNGADDQPLSVATTTAGKISIANLTAGKSYAYVYISTDPTGSEINQYEPISVTNSSPISGNAGDTFYKLAISDVTSGTDLTSAEAPEDNYLYFSVTTNGTGTTTYSYISPIGEGKMMPVGCKKVAKSSLTTVAGDQNADTSTYLYFDQFIMNDGEYSVKVIKIVA